MISVSRTALKRRRTPTPRPVDACIVLNSRLGALAQVENRILRSAGRFGYHASDRFAIKLALEEALANAIKHGNCCDPTKRVKVDYHIDSRMARISIEDEGCGFNPGSVPDPTIEENLEKPCGRGVMLMRCYMNKVEFSSSGNRVTMVRLRTSTRKASQRKS